MSSGHDNQLLHYFPCLLGFHKFFAFLAFLLSWLSSLFSLSSLSSIYLISSLSPARTIFTGNSVSESEIRKRRKKEKSKRKETTIKKKWEREEEEHSELHYEKIPETIEMAFSLICKLLPG